jgi:hypothetical protein
LYDKLYKLTDAANNCYYAYEDVLATGAVEEIAEAVWDAKGYTIGPYADADLDTPDSVLSKSYPSYCGAVSL